MPRLVTGDFTGQIIHACWVIGTNTTGNLETGNGKASWRVPAKCVLLAYDETTGTAQLQGGLTLDANTTGVTFMLRNTNTTGQDLLGTEVTITSARYAQDGILLTTQTTLILDKGDVINVDLDVANSQEGAMLVQAYLMGL